VGVSESFLLFGDFEVEGFAPEDEEEIEEEEAAAAEVEGAVVEGAVVVGAAAPKGSVTENRLCSSPVIESLRPSRGNPTDELRRREIKSSAESA